MPNRRDGTPASLAPVKSRRGWSRRPPMPGFRFDGAMASLAQPLPRRPGSGAIAPPPKPRLHIDGRAVSLPSLSRAGQALAQVGPPAPAWQEPPRPRNPARHSMRARMDTSRGARPRPKPWPERPGRFPLREMHLGIGVAPWAAPSGLDSEPPLSTKDGSLSAAAGRPASPGACHDLNRAPDPVLSNGSAASRHCGLPPLGPDFEPPLSTKDRSLSADAGRPASPGARDDLN